jgi:membrane protein DedA with SNARE-associated domain
MPGVRHVTAIVAGTSKLRPLLFAIFAYSGALLWSATFIGLGFFFGDQWSQVPGQVHKHLEVIAWGVLVFILLYLIWRYRKRASK